jgi:hypothetical protein
VSERRAPTLDELEGFRAGLAHALFLRRRDGTPDEEAERSLEEADRQLRSRRLPEAERTLVAIDHRLLHASPERELSEFPRGLVSYTPTDGPESPTPPEDDPLRNRLLLLRRLAALRASQGRPVDGILDTLLEAEHALDAGDRTTAKRLGESAHTELEAPSDRSSDRRTRERRREA